MSEICLKLTTNTPERRQLRYSVVFIVNFEKNLHIVVVSSSFYFCVWASNASCDSDSFYQTAYWNVNVIRIL